MDYFEKVIELIRLERKRQIEKWGKQNHLTFVWLAILVEEVGEVSQAALHDAFGGKAEGTLMTEIIHVAAVAVQILEMLVEENYGK